MLVRLAEKAFRPSDLRAGFAQRAGPTADHRTALFAKLVAPALSPEQLFVQEWDARFKIRKPYQLIVNEMRDRKSVV